MTGHGVGVAEDGDARVYVEARSVNHRFLDLKLRGAQLSAALEEKLGRLVRKELARGTVTVYVREEGALGHLPVVDVDAGKRVFEELDRLRHRLGLQAPVDLALVVAQPGVIHLGTRDGGDDDELRWSLLDRALGQALTRLQTMRKKEGEALVADISGQLDLVVRTVATIESRVKATVDDAAERLRDRIQKIMNKGAADVDEQRMATEVALLADRLDISEELVRLSSHVGQMRTFLATDEPVGRKLEFLTQEMGREINTVGAKSQSAEIANAVVEAKAALEKIREQIQNVE